MQKMQILGSQTEVRQGSAKGTFTYLETFTFGHTNWDTS